MEGAVGIALSAAGLAALFSTCVDCFNLVNSCRAYGRHYQILLTKLDVEKTRFLQWGEGVGLFNLNPHSRHPWLDTNPQQETTIAVLNCIKLLLTDADQLRLKYGINENCEGRSSTPSADTTIISNSRLQSFKEAYAKFRDRIALQ